MLGTSLSGGNRFEVEGLRQQIRDRLLTEYEVGLPSQDHLISGDWIAASRRLDGKHTTESETGETGHTKAAKLEDRFFDLLGA